MKLHEISNMSLTAAQIEWLEVAVNGSPREVDGKINVIGNVKVPSATKSFPIQFGKVTGDFDCAYTQITSLEGSPSKVGGYFNCQGTKITSLKGSPSKVGGHFYCHGTNITSLIGVADNITRINGVIWASWSKIETGGLCLVLMPGLKGLSSVSIIPNQFKIISKYLGRPDDIFDCQAELIENGFEEHAIL